MQDEVFRVGQLVRENAPKLWRGRQVLRVAKRRGRKDTPHYYQHYFVVTWEGKAGHGSWLKSRDLVSLSPLEMLAVQAE